LSPNARAHLNPPLQLNIECSNGLTTATDHARKNLKFFSTVRLRDLPELKASQFETVVQRILRLRQEKNLGINDDNNSNGSNNGSNNNNNNVHVDRENDKVFI
jgi:hypothetical protein